MRPQSAKAKGRRLQQEVRDAWLAEFIPQLEPDDVRSTSMGASGEDLQLSPAARKLIPFAHEMGNQERINIWEKIAQAEKHAEKAGPGISPLVVFRKNHSRTYAVLPFDVLVDMTKASGPLG